MRLLLVGTIALCLGDTVSAFFNFGGKSEVKPNSVAGDISPFINGVRGISILEKDKYVPGSTFVCDGGKAIPFADVNDNFCDCADGSDEPGTAACRNSEFRCLNKGFKLAIIPPSRVDDGICDCCDGSDEGVITAACPNTCDVHASKQRAMMEKIASSFKAGYSVRLAYAEQATQKYQTAMLALDSLVQEETVHRQQKESLLTNVQSEEIFEKSEVQELHYGQNLKLDRVLKLNSLQADHVGQVLLSLLDVYSMNTADLRGNLRRIVYSGSNAVVSPPIAAVESRSSSEATGTTGESDDDLLDDLDLDDEGEQLHRHDEDMDTSVVAADTTTTGTVSEAWFIALTPSEQDVCKQLTNDLKEASLLPVCQHKSGGDATTRPVLLTAQLLLKEIMSSKKAYKELQYALIGVLDGRGVQVPAVITAVDADVTGEVTAVPVFQQKLITEFVNAHIPLTAEECMAEFPSAVAPEHSPCRVAEELELICASHGCGSVLHHERESAKNARLQLKEVEKKLEDAASLVRTHRGVMEDHTSYSNYLPYLALKNQCFNVKEAEKFEYTLCMFEHIKQRELHGSHNSVELGKFSKFSETEEGGVVMHFEHGTNCWAHGPRKADITVICGPQNQLKEAREPSTCHYTLEFESPAACSLKFATMNGIEV